jgi:hypothetical protein
MSMSDRRKLKRRHLVYYLRVYNARSRRLLGHLVDVSSDGIMVMSDRRLRLGRTATLRMVLPATPRRGRAIEFEATSVWHRRDVNPDFWDVGFQVTSGLTRKQAADIETLIDDYGFRD